MFENKYPYTDFSQLNLDWFLLKFKELLEEQERVSGKVKDLDDTVKEFTDFVTNYFDNLDVQAEVNVKLNEMAADGTLSDLLAPLVAADIGDVVADQIGDTVAGQIGDTVADQIDAVVADQIGAAVAPEIPGAVTDWLNDNVDPVGSAVVVDSTLTVQGAAADAKAVGEALVSLDQLKNLNIEGFSRIYKEASGTLYTNTLIQNDGSHISLAGWRAVEIEVNEGETYFITATGNPAILIFDENDTRLFQYNPGPYLDISNYEVVMPMNAKKLCVNRLNYNPIVLGYQYEYINTANILTRDQKENYLNFGKVFENNIGLYASQNGLFNFIEMKNNDSAFKTCGDDIAPILLNNAGYVGANHGYNFGYECLSAAHGLSDSDIGKTYIDGDNTWVLIKIISTDKFQMVCYDSSTWFKAKTNTVPAAVNFGVSLNITSSSLVQIYPSVKNGTVEVVENTEDKAVIHEQYDIIDLGDALDKIIANVGDNDNDSLVNLADCILHLNTIYEFNKFGAVTIYQQVQKLQGYAIINSIYGSQCIAFGLTDLFAVLGTTIPTLQNSVLSTDKSIWTAQDKAPSVFIKTNADRTKGFAIVYLIDRTSDIYSDAGYIYPTSMKLYPNMVQPAYDASIRKYENIILRFPFVKNSDAAGPDFLSYTKVGTDVYLFVGNLTAKTVDIVLDEYENIYGRSVSIVESNNITLNTNIIVSSINITSSGEGYALLKIS